MPEAGVEHEVQRGKGGIGSHRGQQAPVEPPQALIARDGRQRRQGALLQDRADQHQKGVPTTEARQPMIVCACRGRLAVLRACLSVESRCLPKR